MNKIKVGNTWRNISVPSARVNGTWRPCKQMWVKAGGTWRITFDLTEPDPFDGTGSLEQTPGNVPWEQLSGTWTKSSGLVTASDASNRVAAVDAGTTDITINVDADDANKSGQGVAFWIQDQLNWWGLKTFYNYFSFTTPSNSFYNHFCNVEGTQQTLNNFTRVAQINGNTTTNYSRTGSNYIENRFLTRFCCCRNGSVTVNATTTTSCASSCSGVSFPACSKTVCGSQNQRFCAGACVAPGSSCPSNVFSPNQTFANNTCASGVNVCPASGNFTGNITGNLGANCSSSFNVTYSCNFQTCATCTYTPPFNFSARYFSVQNSNKNCTGPAGTSYVTSFSCVSDPVRLPPNTTFVYETQLQLIRSNAGSVNVIGSQSYSNMGNVYAATSGNTVTARAYSSTGQSGTLYGPWSYDAGSVPRGNKHGILISSVPYQQTFSISRFKADL